MNTLEACHDIATDCLCCGQESPDAVVMNLITQLAGDALSSHETLQNDLQAQLELALGDSGSCASCVMRRIAFTTLHLSGPCCESADPKPLKQSLPLNSIEGRALLASTPYQRDLIPLFEHFEVQQEGWWCAVATATMILNALGVQRPPSKYADYKLFTQSRFFEDEVVQSLGLTAQTKSGISLGQLEQILDAKEGVWALKHEMREPNEDAFRNTLKAVLKDDSSYLAVNYSRSVAEQGGGAHFSPVAAYHEAADAVLILDTAKFKYGPFWMPLRQLVTAMHTQDSKDPEAYRGYLCVSSSGKLAVK